MVVKSDSRNEQFDRGKILEKLWNIDLVAYIRFTSIYRKFDDISTFMK
jgi:transcriptional regulator NrdR family protein